MSDLVDTELYSDAARLALIALGRTVGRRGRPRRWVAQDDPLAHWELTERIVELARSTKD